MSDSPVAAGVDVGSQGTRARDNDRDDNSSDGSDGNDGNEIRFMPLFYEPHLPCQDDEPEVARVQAVYQARHAAWLEGGPLEQGVRLLGDDGDGIDSIFATSDLHTDFAVNRE